MKIPVKNKQTKEEVVFGVVKPDKQAAGNPKKLIHRLDGSRLVNKKSGQVVIKDYKNKTMWKLFPDGPDANKKGSRLVLKNQEGFVPPKDDSGSLSVYYFNPNPANAQNPITNPNEQIKVVKQQDL